MSLQDRLRAVESRLCAPQPGRYSLLSRWELQRFRSIYDPDRDLLERELLAAEMFELIEQRQVAGMTEAQVELMNRIPDLPSIPLSNYLTSEEREELGARLSGATSTDQRSATIIEFRILAEARRAQVR